MLKVVPCSAVLINCSKYNDDGNINYVAEQIYNFLSQSLLRRFVCVCHRGH